MISELPSIFTEDGYRRVGVPVAIDEVLNPEIQNLLSRFVSIGADCELGLLQRRYHAERGGLLRWMALPIHIVSEMIEANFLGIGDEEGASLVTAPWGELFLSDQKYGVTCHTFVHEDGVDAATFLKKECARRKFLAKRILDDLSSAKKTFVYKANYILHSEEINRLCTAIKQHNPENPIVIIQPPAPDASYSCELAGHRIVMARLQDLGPNEQGLWDIHYDAWLSLFRDATRLLECESDMIAHKA